MKKLKKMRFVPTLLTLSLAAMMAVPSISMAAQPTVSLGLTESYAVLAGSEITNTGTTTINGDAGGDVGLYPGTAYTGGADVTASGTVHLADDEAIAAKDDLVTAYDDAVGRTPVTTIPTELGGVTLTPGTYDSADGTFQITGTLTLDAQGDPDGVFIFKAASTLITASDSNVELINSARYCRTFWPVGSSATLGTNSHFVGHIFAMTSITAGNGATVQGQLLARNGAVTLNNNTITNGICLDTPASEPKRKPKRKPAVVPVSTTATLNVIKRVINDDGGIAVADDFSIHVKSDDGDVAGSPAPGSESPGTEYSLPAGTYSISENVLNGYSASYSGDGDSSGNIVLTAGDNKTVTVTNNDTAAAIIAPSVIAPLVTAPPEIVPPAIAPPEALIPLSDLTPGAVITPLVVTPSVVGAPSQALTSTISGGELPKTATPWYNLLLGGVALTLLGTAGWKLRTR